MVCSLVRYTPLGVPRAGFGRAPVCRSNALANGRLSGKFHPSVRMYPASAIQANGTVLAEPTFDARHAADAVLYMASLPLDANVQFLTITATTMPFIGRG